MKTKVIFSMIVLMAVAASLMIPTALAATVNISPSGEHTKRYDMGRNGFITYDWSTQDGEYIDFWIEDSTGDRVETSYDDNSDFGIFYVTDPGKYDLVWRNDNMDTVTVTYDIQTTGANVAEDLFAGLFWTAVIVGVIILIVIIVVIVAVMSGKKSAPQQGQYPQQQYQQQQYQQPYQQPYQQQYPQQQYPQQPQEPQQPGQQYPPGQ